MTPQADHLLCVVYQKFTPFTNDSPFGLWVVRSAKSMMSFDFNAQYLSFCSLLSKNFLAWHSIGVKRAIQSTGRPKSLQLGSHLVDWTMDRTEYLRPDSWRVWIIFISTEGRLS